MKSQHETLNDDRAVEWLRCALGLEEGKTPFPWQIELLRRFLRGESVSALDIPTGLGKTAAMAVWLVARARGAALPRRLVYVVDRRAVVDQATEVAEQLQAWVKAQRPIAEVLGLGDRPLPISTLRGQYVDNRDWLEDPSAPAIVVGTVDMVGSRLLFSGYGVSPKMRPYHAGLIGTDTLLVLDEAHLVPAFEDLLRQVEDGTNAFGPKDAAFRDLLPKFAVLSLSATGRQTDSTQLTLTEADHQHPIVSKRLTAKKSLTTVNVTRAATDVGTESSDNESEQPKIPKLASELATQAWQLTNDGSDPVRCLVYCHARVDATTVANELRGLADFVSAPEPTIELFVGARRVRERIQARDALARLGFLAGTSVKRQRAAFLIATSAGEVGVDLDADHMVCDMVAWERMVQRLGRVNRRGEGDAKVVVVMESEPAPAKGAAESLQKRDAANRARHELEKRTKKRDELVTEQEKQVSRAKEPLTAKLTKLQAEMSALPRGKKRTDEEKSKTENLKREKKNLKEELKMAQKDIETEQKKAREPLDRQIKQCKDRIKAFKDADAKVVARYEIELAQHRALRKLLETVGDGGSLSLESLLRLRRRRDLADALRDATSVEPLRPELTRALVDAWSMTSLDEHPGRPDVDPWLRGFRPNDPPQTTLVWRQYLPVRSDGSFEPKAATRFFEAAPAHASEQLETETRLARDWLIERAAAPEPTRTKKLEIVLDKRALDSGATKLSEQEVQLVNEYDAKLAAYRARPASKAVVAIALTSRGGVKGWWKLEQLKVAAKKGKEESKESKATREKILKQLEELLTGATLIVDARLGGLTDGLLDGQAGAIAEAADDASMTWLARPDVPDVPVTGFRVLRLRMGEKDDASFGLARDAGDGWVRRYLFPTEVVDGEPSEALLIDGRACDAATEDEKAEADRPQQLDEHQNWAEECARAIVKRLQLSKDHEDLLALAARLHDEGKRAASWQRAFKAPRDGCVYAKTRGPIDFAILDGYRHELGSLPYVEKNDEFSKLSNDEAKDLILHIIAAHHGYARPVIGTSGYDDAPPSVADERAREVALRFARLSRRWGPWGLAWWECLLRAADQGASRRNQQLGTLAARRGHR
jgi:CRISPR-associated endonuclease/helicase Cas3